MTATTIIDVRILDTFEGARHVKQLEDSGLELVFAVENPDDKTADELRGHGIVIQSSRKQSSRDFWNSVFDFVTVNNTVVGVASHWDHWALQLVSEERNIPYRFVFNKDSSRMNYLGN